MGWFFGIVGPILFVLVLVWFFHLYYAKATREVALVRTGMGGKKVVIDGGCFVLPIVHSLQKISMRAITIRQNVSGTEAVLTGDKLRADLEMEFEVRVHPSQDGVANAAQALGLRIVRGGDQIAELFEGKLVSAMQAAAAARTLAEIHADQTEFVTEITSSIQPFANSMGMKLESVSMLRVDQGNFANFDENNAFNAEGMRKLTHLVARHREERVRIETSTEIAVRESRLHQVQRQLEIERIQRESEIAQKEHLTRLAAEAQAVSAEKKTESASRSELAEIDRNTKRRLAQVEKDELLRRKEMEAILSLEESKIDNSVKLALRRIEEAEAKADEELSRSKILLAAETVQTEKQRAAARREQEIALLMKEGEASVQAVATNSEINTNKALAQAQANVVEISAKAEQARLEAEAQGRAATIQAENSLSEKVIRMRLEEQKLEQMPEILKQMMKPVEKIDSIKINQIGGVGGSSEASKGSNAAFGSAMDQILGMAVSLPAMKKMGEEIGLDFEPNIASRAASDASRMLATQRSKSSKTKSKSK